MKTIVYVPFTGLGLYGGFRGNRWLRNRIKIFNNFVLPALRNQTDQDFVLWIGWRPEERTNPYVQAFLKDLQSNRYNPKTIFTYTGLCFYDDKLEDDVARQRLGDALRKALPELMDAVSDADEIMLLTQPSDDLYHQNTIRNFKLNFQNNPDLKAVGYVRGYLCNYNTKQILEYNPKTNPPFFAYKMKKDKFFHVAEHLRFISTQIDEGKYPAGTPYPSHEWIPNAFAPMGFFEERGFLVGTHGENISTHFNHPYGGAEIIGEEKLRVLKEFGIIDSPILKLKFSLRKWLLRKLPYKAQRKLRYWFGELIFSKFYNWIRN